MKLLRLKVISWVYFQWDWSTFWLHNPSVTGTSEFIQKLLHLTKKILNFGVHKVIYKTSVSKDTNHLLSMSLIHGGISSLCNMNKSKLFQLSSPKKEIGRTSTSKNLPYKFFSSGGRAPKLTLPPPPQNKNDEKNADFMDDFIHSVKTSLQTDKTTFTPEIKNTTVTPSVTKGIHS